MSRARMLYNDTALNKIINIKWKGKWQEETVFRFKQGLGATIEGKVKDKFRISITDSTSGKTIQHYTVMNLAFTRAYKRSFDNSGVEVEPWKAATKKVNTGYLMSSYKTVELETSAITLQDLLVHINVPEFDGHLPKLEPDTVRVFCNENSLGNIEVNVGESVRLKTKGNGPYIEYVARLDE
ncbi:Arpin, partial [Paramuricea clavata]